MLEKYQRMLKNIKQKEKGRRLLCWFLMTNAIMQRNLKELDSLRKQSSSNSTSYFESL